VNATEHPVETATPSALRIVAARGGHAPDSSGGHLSLASELEYVVTGSRSALERLEAALAPSTCRRIGDALLLAFGNTVGDLVLPGLGRVRLRSGKWGEAEFESMLADITKASAALPFSPGSGGALPYDRSIANDRDVLLHAFVHLRHALSPHAPREHHLVPALRAIVADPHSRFVRERRWTPFDRVRRMDARTVAAIGGGRTDFVEVPAGRGGGLATRLEGRLPERFDEPVVEHTVDVAENRFVKAFLDQVDGILDAVEALASRETHLRARLTAQVDELRTILAPILRHPLWRSVGRMTRFPVESTVLQQRRGYRDVLRHFVQLRRSSRLARLDTWQRLLELKDVATLYELWTYFEVARAIGDSLGAPVAALETTTTDFSQSLSNGLRIEWRNGVALDYNRSFTRSSRSGCTSYSVPLRPDIALWTADGSLHLFDAKFRFDPRQLDGETERVAKAADIHKMHAYRDAIPQARSATVLYPGSRETWFEAVDGAAREGVGAIPCVPDDRISGLEQLIRDLFSPKGRNEFDDPLSRADSGERPAQA